MSGLPGNRPLSDNMQGVLKMLLKIHGGERWYAPCDFHRYPATPNEIAIEMGIHEGGRRHGNGAAIRSWSGHMAPAQRIISGLTGLRYRGLISLESRPDKRMGSAYALTFEGFERARELARADRGAIEL